MSESPIVTAQCSAAISGDRPSPNVMMQRLKRESSRVSPSVDRVLKWSVGGVARPPKTAALG